MTFIMWQVSIIWHVWVLSLLMLGLETSTSHDYSFERYLPQKRKFNLFFFFTYTYSFLKKTLQDDWKKAIERLLSFIWLEIVLWNPSVSLLYKWISTVCKSMLYFSSCWTEGNERELKRKWTPSAEKWTLWYTEKQLLKRVSCFKSYACIYMCTFCVIHMLMCVWVLPAAYVCDWQKVSKLAVLTCRLAGGGLEEPWTSAAPDEELGSAWNSVWFSTWSPHGSAQSCRDLDSAPLRWTFQKETVQLHCINSRLQELRRDETRITIQYCL